MAHGRKIAHIDSIHHADVAYVLPVLADVDQKLVKCLCCRKLELVAAEEHCTSFFQDLFADM